MKPLLSSSVVLGLFQFISLCFRQNRSHAMHFRYEAILIQELEAYTILRKVEVQRSGKRSRIISAQEFAWKPCDPEDSGKAWGPSWSAALQVLTFDPADSQEVTTDSPGSRKPRCSNAVFRSSSPLPDGLLSCVCVLPLPPEDNCNDTWDSNLLRVPCLAPYSLTQNPTKKGSEKRIPAFPLHPCGEYGDHSQHKCFLCLWKAKEGLVGGLSPFL